MCSTIKFIVLRFAPCRFVSFEPYLAVVERRTECSYALSVDRTMCLECSTAAAAAAGGGGTNDPMDATAAAIAPADR
jgi:hypothetical protein